MIYLLPFLACLSLTCALEVLFKPYHANYLKRRIRGVFITINLVFITQIVFLIITQRPVFSALLTSLIILLLLLVNNAKYAALREPLVFSDLFLYLQAIHYPRLYFPFLGLPVLVTLPIAIILTVYLGFSLESGIFECFFSSSVMLLGVLGLAILVLLKLAAKATISGELESDIKSYGILSVLCIYATLAVLQRGELEKRLLNQSPFTPTSNQDKPVKNEVAQLPDIIAIQSESFFDARKLSENIKKTVLESYDQYLTASFQHGALSVPAWGANTMRTEFAFLSAYRPETLGLARFYPYQQLLKMNSPRSLITYLKQLGYRCVCIHPHDSGFFLRDRFFEKLGFDLFIDEQSFENPQRVGPYISDAEVCKKIISTSRQYDDQPLFIFAITMENHGPLHLESVGDGEWKQYFGSKPDGKSDDLTAYLRHLKNADAMIANLIDFYKGLENPVGIVFYGDHVPAISDTFDEYHFYDDRSNYFIWNNYSDAHLNADSEKTSIEPKDIKVEDLALTLLASLKLSPHKE